jgi:hypothetical protein
VWRGQRKDAMQDKLLIKILYVNTTGGFEWVYIPARFHPLSVNCLSSLQPIRY